MRAQLAAASGRELLRRAGEDALTDARVLVGQHGVYCQSARQPGRSAMDIQIITKAIVDAKELVTSSMTELKRQQTD